jgi:hypothetical protein
MSTMMSQSLFAALAVFGAVMAFTPGPNNIMVLSSGLTYGFRRSLPHIAGIAIGVSLMVASVGLGVGAIFIAYPVLQTILKYAGIAYLSGRGDRDVRAGDAGAGQPARPDDILGRGAVPVGQRQGLGDGNRHHYRLFGGGRLSGEYRHPGCGDVRDGGVVVAALDPVRNFLALVFDLAAGGAGFQRGDGRVAAGLADSSVHGRMMPHRAMRDQGFP